MTSNSNPIQKRSVYYQDTPPSDPEDGDLWTDTSGNNVETNQRRSGSWELVVGEGPDTPEYPVKGGLWTDGQGDLRRYNGSAWVSVAADPITIMDSAEKFDGSGGESITGKNNIVVKGGSLQFKSRGATTTRTSDDSTSASTGNYGIVFNPNIDMDGIKVDISSNTGDIGSKTVYVERQSDNNTMGSTTASISSGTTVKISASLSSGKDYAVYVDGGADWGKYSSPSWTISGSGIDLIGMYEDGSYREGAGDAAIFNDFTPVVNPTSGSANVEWPHPDDIHEWDKATYLKSQDGETVDVYLATSTDGGATWSRINSGNPISRGYGLSSVSASSRVRFEVEFSRVDTSNNPTFDAAYRRGSV